MFPSSHRRRRGFSLLELVITTSLVGITMFAISTLLRTSLSAWDAVESDRSLLDATHGVVRHFVRGLRQAQAVTSCTASTAQNGSITVTTVDNLTAVWTLSNGTVLYSVNGVSEIVATQVSQLSFTGLKLDGTEATVPSDIRSVRILVSVLLNRDVNNTRSIRSTAWLRVKN